MKSSRATSCVLVAFALLACACGKSAAAPRAEEPACKGGAFSSKLSRIMPSIAPLARVELGEPGKIKKNIEPGCMVPFRDEHADGKLRDVGRVDVETIALDEGKSTLVGHGRLYVARAKMTLVVNDDAGDEKMLLAVDGRRIVLRRKGESPLKTSVAVGKGASWPLPFDAIVAALEGCDADVRLGANEDVSVVAARRGPYRMWRMRFLDADQPNAIDTSFVCGEDDALLGYRSQAGVLGFSMVVASVRSDVALVIKQQTRSETDVNPNDVGPAVEFDDE